MTKHWTKCRRFTVARWVDRRLNATHVQQLANENDRPYVTQPALRKTRPILPVLKIHCVLQFLEVGKTASFQHYVKCSLKPRRNSLMTTAPPVGITRRPPNTSKLAHRRSACFLSI